jgi:hypothetical protein
MYRPVLFFDSPVHVLNFFASHVVSRRKQRRENMTEYFNPAPVVVGLVFPEPQKVVTITRSIEPFIGQDALPGGYVEREPWREALAREINDEAHISVRPVAISSKTCMPTPTVLTSNFTISFCPVPNTSGSATVLNTRNI